MNSIDILDLTVRSAMGLQAEKVSTVEQLVSLVSAGGPNAVLRIPRLGRASTDEIIQACFRFFEHVLSKDTTRLRDEFAAKAIAGLLANSEAVHVGAEPTNSGLSGDNKAAWAMGFASSAYIVADAMLAAREAS